jgi:hypothetical protein
MLRILMQFSLVLDECRSFYWIGKVGFVGCIAFPSLVRYGFQIQALLLRGFREIGLYFPR